MAKIANADKYTEAFQDEAREVLIELEATLLELNEDHGNADLVGRAFRALHTIKGSGSMFGFDRVARFTHNVETAFDAVRNGRLAVTSPLIDLTLAALDQIKAMLNEASGSAVADEQVSVEILDKLEELTGLKDRRRATDARPTKSARLDELEPGGAAAEAMQEWQIQFLPGLDLLRNGADPLLLLRELKQLGHARITANLGAIPPMSELDAERCYIGWEIVLSTTATREAIRDVFIFVEDLCELTIEPVAAASTIEGKATPAASSQAAAFERRREAGSPQGNGTSFGRRVDDPDAAVRVPAGRLDELVNLVGELVTVQARLSEISVRRDDPDVVAVAEEVERLTAALRETSMSIRMVPIRGTFERFRRLVHDLARDLHKDVELTIEGAETELDKTVVDQLNDPLMHLIRNCMDHGIETSAARVAAGKPATAKLHLAAKHSGANVLIAISDDGGGIDAAAVQARAIERGLVSAERQLSEAEIFALILEPGFSTAQTITDVSGRGVGMDVVRQRVAALRGTIDIASKTGAGTTVTLRLPLTMAIIDGLLVRVDDAYFVLPLANTLECIELTREDIARSNGKSLARVRGEIVPYLRLRDYFGIRTKRPEREQIMIAETEHGRIGFAVDEVLGDHQTVIKNLGRLYRQVQIVSGATILGNGNVALILDPHRLAQDAIHDEARQVSAEMRAPAALAATEAAAAESVLMNSS